jgi:hypothetical protein
MRTFRLREVGFPVSKSESEGKPWSSNFKFNNTASVTSTQNIVWICTVTISNTTNSRKLVEKQRYEEGGRGLG